MMKAARARACNKCQRATGCPWRRPSRRQRFVGGRKEDKVPECHSQGRFAADRRARIKEHLSSHDSATANEGTVKSCALEQMSRKSSLPPTAGRHARRPPRTARGTRGRSPRVLYVAIHCRSDAGEARKRAHLWLNSATGIFQKIPAACGQMGGPKQTPESATSIAQLPWRTSSGA